jgi:hypothetical protein
VNRYDPQDLQLILFTSGAKWLWVLEDMQGESIAHGSSGDYVEACRQAHVAYCQAVNGEVKP